VASEKYLAVVGLNEEDTAHLRLLLRMVAGQLEHRWRWGAEENADLVIIDPSDLAGQLGRNRAYSGGRRCAVFSESEPLRDGELRLNAPLKPDNVVAVINGNTSGQTRLNVPVIQQKEDFYDLGTLNPEFQLEDEETADARSWQRESKPALGLDELLQPDTESKKPQFAVPGKLDAETRIEGTHGPSARSERRVADSIAGLRKQQPEGINIGPPVKHGSLTADSARHGLRDYLRSPLLGGPATICIEGAPSLTLDPKEKAFHTIGKLRTLTPYCNADLPRSAWRPVTTHDLGRVRAEQPAQPYSRLIWLDALIRSGGRLASHLDPGGRYKLKRQQQTEADFPNHASILTALAAPAKLNEIATASGKSMNEVFDVVNAYDAIGLIEVERRLPRHAEPKPSGLLARLRKPFGKS
jgi:hypothetical protein